MSQINVVEVLDKLGRIRGKLATVQQSLLPTGPDQVARGQALILMELEAEISEVEESLNSFPEPGIIGRLSQN
jgi:hypothetical protein